MTDNIQNNSETVLVGVVSDTHGRLPHKAFAALADCDYLIHAGDIGSPSILQQLKALAPVYAVLGNNDFDEYGDEVRRIIHPVIGKVHFLVAHYPQDVHIGFNGGPGLAPGDPVPQVCIHGHTHVPKIVTGKDASPAQYIICPGSVFRPRNRSKPSVAKLIISQGRIQDLWIEEI